MACMYVHECNRLEGGGNDQTELVRDQRRRTALGSHPSGRPWALAVPASRPLHAQICLASTPSSPAVRHLRRVAMRGRRAAHVEAIQSMSYVSVKAVWYNAGVLYMKHRKSIYDGTRAHHACRRLRRADTYST